MEFQQLHHDIWDQIWTEDQIPKIKKGPPQGEATDHPPELEKEIGREEVEHAHQLEESRFFNVFFIILIFIGKIHVVDLPEDVVDNARVLLNQFDVLVDKIQIDGVSCWQTFHSK